MPLSERHRFLGREDPAGALAFVEGAQRVTGIEYRNQAMVVKERLGILAGMLSRWGEFPQEIFEASGEGRTRFIDRRCIFVEPNWGNEVCFVNSDGQLFKQRRDSTLVPSLCVDDMDYARFGQVAVDKLSRLVKEAIAASPKPVTPPPA